ncbi:MAG: lipopolysaccharide biosynthesis protein [Marinicellaceae bacterium]
MKKQFTKNLSINIFAFITNILVSLWLTPYLIKHLGIIAYGLIPLAMFFSQYIGVILNSINISIGRHLLIAIQKKQDFLANKIFNTSFIVVLIFTLIQALIMLIILFDITYFFSIPKELINDAIWLFGLTFLGFSFSLIRSVFDTSLFSHNRLDILRGIDILQNLFRLGIIIFLFLYDEPSLKNVGIANFLSSLLLLLPSIHFFRKYTPQIKINFKYFDRLTAKELSNMSTWILINQVGVLLLGNLDLYLVNILISNKATGEYAIILQITNMLRMSAIVLVGVMAPITLIYYAKQEFKKLKMFIMLVSKLLAIFIAIPIAIAIYFSAELLTMWLGTDYNYLANIVSFSMLFLLVAVPIMPFYQLNIAHNKLKVPALVTILFGILNFAIIYLIVKNTNFGLSAFIAAKLFFVIAYNAIFMPYYVSRFINLNSKSIAFIPLLSILTFLVFFGALVFLVPLLAVNNIFKILLISVTLTLLLTPILIYLLISSDERTFIHSLYKKKIKKIQT